VSKTLHSRVVQRACDGLGGVEPLAERLGVSLGAVRMLVDGKLPLPPSLFFRVVDLLQEADPYGALVLTGPARLRFR
jgi:hypothetical protein